MAKKKAAKAAPEKSQAERMLELARKARENGQAFAHALGKDTMARPGTKPRKLG